MMKIKITIVNKRILSLIKLSFFVKYINTKKCLYMTLEESTEKLLLATYIIVFLTMILVICAIINIWNSFHVRDRASNLQNEILEQHEPEPEPEPEQEPGQEYKQETEHEHEPEHEQEYKQENEQENVE